jgi:hypothetical protein
MREGLKDLLKKASADDPKSLQALACALERAGYPKRGHVMMKPSRAEVFRLSEPEAFSVVIALQDREGEPVHIPELVVVSVCSDRQSIHLYAPNALGEI